MLFFLFVFFPAFASAADSLLLGRELKCDENFPCPKELYPRIDFWMKVFYVYDSHDVIFHDPDEPRRIYAVFENFPEYCPSRMEDDPPRIREKRKQIASLLNSVWKKRDQDLETWSDEEKRIRSLFIAKNPDDLAGQLEEAAGRIRCQNGGRDHFQSAIRKWGAYRDFIVAELRKAGIPEDFQFLPFSESSYETRAVSVFDAAGIWQLMYKTAREFGLQVDDGKKIRPREIDQRMDPFMATPAALAFIKRYPLRVISRVLEEVQERDTSPWPYVLISYNNGMRDPVRAIRKLGPNIVDIIEKYEAHRWGNAARNFYPCFLAARELARNYQDYFPGIQLDPPLTYAEAPLPVSASPGNISRSLGVPIEELRRLNPSVTDAVWDATEDSPRFVPAGFTLKLPVSSEKNWTELALRIPEENIRYTVRPGDNLPRIAKKFGVAQATLKRLNNLTAKNSVVYIYPNQILTIPVRGELMNPGKEPREASGETL